MSNPALQLYCRNGHAMARGVDWCQDCGEPPAKTSAASTAHATDVECPVKSCGAWVGWACQGQGYGYHAAGYHPSRQRAADRAATEQQIDLTAEMKGAAP